MKSVAFIEANLSKVIFTYSVIDSVNFINCEWAREEKGEKRKFVYDAVNPAKDVSKWELLRQYIQLKKNFENQKDFVGTGDWSYREMECRKKLAKEPPFKIGLLRRPEPLLSGGQSQSIYPRHYYRKDWLPLPSLR